MDSDFQREQDHLDWTYDLLKSIEEETEDLVQSTLSEALEHKENLFSELTRDFSSDIQVETLAELEALNRVIEGYNLSADINLEKLNRTRLLLKCPYFAKITLTFEQSGNTKDIYIGAAGMTDGNRRHFIVDWRSPIAEVYYNRENGRTSYEANDRMIDVDLKLRRQFDIAGRTLRAYFDTTVAIEDPLLLATLARRHSDKLEAITTTIQKEQNQVIRHADVPALLVQGVAGSGKTSVLLQRIAYLFYRERDTLKPEDVYLITPNPVFRSYIDSVLPNMGESNPQILTWNALMEHEGLSGRGIARADSWPNLQAIDAQLEGFQLEPTDIVDIRVGKERVITASSIRKSLDAYKRLPLGPHRLTLVIEDLKDKLAQRVMRLAKDLDEQEALAELSTDEQLSVFGQVIAPFGEDEAFELTRQWLLHRYRDVEHALENGDWLRIDRIGRRLLGKETLDETEWLYLKLALVGGGERKARYVMIDEVQDYTPAQLAVLARYFYNAHFLMLGDAHQAVVKGTASFVQIRELFSKTHGSIDTCSLMISYRSTPEIIGLFSRLLPEDERIQVDSVQQPGKPVRLIETMSNEEYDETLRRELQELLDKEGLSACIALDRDRARHAAGLLDDPRLALLDADATLPQNGVVVLDARLAKGLEFDRAIVLGAEEANVRERPLFLRRLYTALSRAIHELAVISNGPLCAELRNQH